MPRKIFSYFLLTLLLASSVHAEFEEDTPVGKASDEGSRHAVRKTWQTISIAAIIIGGAVTALVLTSSGNGSSPSSSNASNSH